MPTRRQALFLSVRGDFHAFVVGELLSRRLGSSLSLSIIDMDDRAARGGFNWELSAAQGTGPVFVRSDQDEWIALDDTDLVWCRRFTRRQRDDDDGGFLSQQWNAASWFLAHAADTTWIDHPRDIIDAESKPRQLLCARGAGFPVPDTLVSQDPERIRAFFDAHSGSIVVKPLKGSVKRQLFTVALAEDAFERPDEFRRFPAIYQQAIEGDLHLRIVALPERTFVFSIKSGELDWRINRNVEIESVDADTELAKKTAALLEGLDLTMGVIDAKVSGDDLFFLEVNPQGQFLFLEALTGVGLAQAYADYFCDVLT